MNYRKKITAALSALVLAGTLSFSVSAAENVKLYGDISNNGVVDVTDLSTFSLYLIGDREFTDEDIRQMDFDRSGRADLADLATLRQYIVRTGGKNTAIIGIPMETAEVTTTMGITDVPATVTSPETTVTEPAVVTTAETTVTAAEQTTVATTTTTIVTTPEPPKESIYYACDGEIYLGVTETVNGGFLGQSYVNYDNVTGSALTFTVNAPEDGNYLMTVRFANGTAVERPLSIFTNDSDSYYYMNFDLSQSFPK